MSDLLLDSVEEDLAKLNLHDRELLQGNPDELVEVLIACDWLGAEKLDQKFNSRGNGPLQVRMRPATGGIIGHLRVKHLSILARQPQVRRISTSSLQDA